MPHRRPDTEARAGGGRIFAAAPSPNTGVVIIESRIINPAEIPVNPRGWTALRLETSVSSAFESDTGAMM